ncbi:HEAT repeat domain-containing protein [Alteraurantiacibacter buctensis]|uniref:HEAT repeat domain-containing protein n=1 Tax=Alteraurantiacibacter buctensis TaxID=1503981 RepID=A0A844YSQ6_9SPHN|nr:HEAT repeat domain-containing protein [Alteraurantiacibacter buctensis]MXO70046.1 hypothetical protein [Alteraurantiacibacter buctensis]
MTSLLALWNVSLTLSGMALFALTLLLLARIHEARRLGRDRTMRSELTAHLLAGHAPTRKLTRAQSEIAGDLTIELAELMRGSDRMHLLERAAAMGVIAVLGRRLHSRVAQDRLTAAEALAMFDGEGQALAATALDDPNRDVRLGAALALAQNNAAPSPAFLAQKLGIGTTERSLLVVSLMRDLAEADANAVQALLTLPGIAGETKVAATEALGLGRLVETTPLVTWIAEALSGDPALQPRIYRALGQMGHPGARDAVAAGLSSPSWEVRAAAADAAGKIGLTDLLGRLSDLLDDDYWWVRLRAGEALAASGAAGRDQLVRAAASGPATARHAANAILAERQLL